MATNSSILTWRIPWAEEPGGLQSMGPQRAWHGLSDLARTKGNLWGKTAFLDSLVMEGPPEKVLLQPRYLTQNAFITLSQIMYHISCPQILQICSSDKDLLSAY